MIASSRSPLIIVVHLSVLLLGAIYLALVAGDIVAKENEDGHYRLLLVRPISRVPGTGVKGTAPSSLG